VTTAQQFYERSKIWLDNIMEKAPVLATQLGDFRFNHTLGDQSLEAQERFISVIKGMQEELQTMDITNWANDALIDHTVMSHISKSLVRGIDKLRDP